MARENPEFLSVSNPLDHAPQRLPDELCTIAVDGGTTNTRARLLIGPTLIAEARRSIGARDVATGGDTLPLIRALRDVIDEVRMVANGRQPDQIVASGMLTSEVGLMPVPHVTAPAGINELARNAVAVTLPEISARPIVLLPGVRTPPGIGPDGWTEADVMRGEECEVIGDWFARYEEGLLDLDRETRATFVLPGSHTKLVALVIRDGYPCIERSYTTLSGEMLAALRGQTILSASLPKAWPQELDPVSVEAGVRWCREAGVGRAAFLVRIAALTTDWTAEQRAAFLIGAIVAEDVSRLCRHSLLQDSSVRKVVVGGSDPVREVYRTLLRDALDRPVQGDVSPYAAALGAAYLAHHRKVMGWDNKA